MPIPKIYQKPLGPAIASYDYTDVAEGTGVIGFKGSRGDASGGIIYSLGTQNIYSSEVATQTTNFTSGGSAWNLIQTINFDLTVFNTPRTIKGTAVIEGSFGVWNAGVHGHSCYIIFDIQHYDGISTYTTLGSASTETLTVSTSGPVWKIKSFVINKTLIQKHFKKGDVLRIATNIYGKHNGTPDPTDGKALLGHDPNNRDYASGATIVTAATNHTTLNFYIPFKLDL